MKQIVIILFLNAIFISCKIEKKNISEVKKESSIGLNNVINSDKIKRYSQDEIMELLKNNRLDNKIEVDSTIEISDNIKIKNIRTGAVISYNLLHKEAQYCFLRDNCLYFILNNLFYNYNSDNYYIKVNYNHVGIIMDSTNMRHSCFESGYASTIKKYKIYLNKTKYNSGDTLKCRALFLNYGKFNDCTKDFYQYFLDSIDVKYIVHPYNKNIHKELLSKFPK